jgi:galactokinase/mevalonate kinase-like predicted kinase
LFHPQSDFSDEDLARVLAGSDEPTALVVAALEQVRDCVAGQSHFRWGKDRGSPRGENGDSPQLQEFTFARVVHALGQALLRLAPGPSAAVSAVLPGLADACSPALRSWLAARGLELTTHASVEQFAAAAAAAAFDDLRRAIVGSAVRTAGLPRNALRKDEIVWARAPARLDLGGGWTDTPPYSLERGGCVINAAVDLNGQPPIHCYVRVIDEPVVRLSSIDRGQRVQIDTRDELESLWPRSTEFALAKGVLILAGFSPRSAPWPQDATLRQMLEAFGGGIELTTLAAIPAGSGLGTSSILGATILAAVQRALGKQLSRQELFHGVLQLEQLLTTGGGWQDQIGAAAEGVKVITGSPGLTPAMRLHFVTPDVLDPHRNGGATLLYYTGVTRLAKNILEQVVGQYLCRDRSCMAALQRLRALPAEVSNAMAEKDAERFGRLLSDVWECNKQLAATATNAEVEALLARVGPHIHGAKLLGAGGGGFLLLVCKSPQHAQQIRELLEAEPPNPLARFFDFSISAQGLVVTVC